MKTTPGTPSEGASRSYRNIFGIAGLVIVLLSILGLIFYYLILPYFTNDTTIMPVQPVSNEKIDQEIPAANTTSTVPIILPPEVPTYTDLAQDFPEIINPKISLFSTRAREMLRNNRFVVIPATNEEFFNVYLSNKEKNAPNFITTDSFLHTTHLVFKHLSAQFNGKKDSTADFLNGVISELNLQTVSALHIPAVFGSKAAETIIKEQNLNISTQPTQRTLADVSKGNEQDYDLSYLLPLTKEKPGNYPDFMKNNAWNHKNLGTFLGNWTELISTSPTRFPVSMNEGVGGPSTEDISIDTRGYVEPEPQIYQTIATITKETRTELEKNKKITPAQKKILINLETAASTLQAISESELNKIPLSENAHHFIMSYGEWLESMWTYLYQADLAVHNGSRETVLALHPLPTLANAAQLTNSNSILQVGTGKVFDIFIIITVNGKQKVARGGVYSFYEIIKPATERIDPKQWPTLITDTLNALPPELPEWTKNYIDLSILGITK